MSKRFKLRNFLLLSLLIHLIIGQLGGQLSILPEKIKIPIRVKFVEFNKEKKEDLDFKRGKIIELPKPEKIEKPTTQKILSKYNSKAHYNKSAVKKSEYKASETIPPRGKLKTKPITQEKIFHYKKPINENTRIKKSNLNKKNEKNTIISKQETEKKELKKIDSTPVVLKGLFKNQNNPQQDQNKKESPIFQGFDPEKFAKLDTGDKEDESDTETISLDSQEFKFVSYFSGIKRQIELVWSYPEQATIHGLRGELLLQFTLNQGGKLIDISVINSSGHKILDSAALKAVTTASPYNPFPSTIDKKKLKIIASFTYKPSYTLYQ